IGMVSDEISQANASAVNVLAYQHYGQSCGYWPGSTATTYDKINVRDGHYYIWGLTHFYAHVDGSGEIIDPNVKKFVGYFTRDVAPPSGLDMETLEIQAGDVPLCAMETTRDDDIAPFQSYASDASCKCLFDAVAL